MPENPPLFKDDPKYQKADRWEIQAHDQTFVIYEFSIAFASHRLLRGQFEDWLEDKGRYLAGLDDSPENRRRLRDLAWHQWFRGRPAQDASRPGLRIGKDYAKVPLRYRDLLTEELRPLHEDSTLWLAERLAWDRDPGHIWKVLINPLHLSRTRSGIERLLLDDAPSPWRTVLHNPSSTPSQRLPDRPSLRWN